MDEIFAEIAKETINFGALDDVKWRDLYTPLYPPAPEDIRVVHDERYGAAERNRLDVYVPPRKNANKPVLLYVHGGGFSSGDKQWNDKVYANIGYHFASKGLVTVVANHQLVEGAKYPDGADDMQLVREWIYANIEQERFGRGSTKKVFLLGHSSGGAHICMNLFAAGDPSRPARDPLFPPVAGVLLPSCPFWFDIKKPTRKRVVESYWGSSEESVWGPRCALGLFQRLPDHSPVLDSKQLPVYLGSVEWEVPETSNALVLFFNAYRARSKPFGTLPVTQVLKKHNHLSNILSIGTDDTAQADSFMNFIDECLTTSKAEKL